MRRQADKQIRRRPHHTEAARLGTETSDKAGSVGRVSQTSRSRTQSTVQVNGELVQRRITLLSGEIWNPGLGVGFRPESQSLVAPAAGPFQKSAEAIVLSVIRHWRQEGPNREEHGGASDELGSRILLRPESTDPARAVQPALSQFPLGDSGAELAPLRGTA